MGLLSASSLWTLVLALLAAVYFANNRDALRPCPHPLEADPVRNPECFYSQTYAAARTLFRTFAERAGANIYQLNLTDSLTIDVAVIRGTLSSKDLVLHFSGTHGVEGFVGSAIQSSFLAYFASRKPVTQKTIVFVHALNAYGMANWRRVNENNIDLNRNALFDEKWWRQVLDRDPNIAGYENWTALLNPQAPPSLQSDATLLLHAAHTLATSSIAKMKRAMVTGTYTSKKGIFYGGTGLQRSHELVRDFLRAQGFTKQVKNLIVIDIHSGLGPFGNDTLMMNENLEAARALWGSSNAKIGDVEWIAPFAFEYQTLQVGSGNFASEGYDLMTGDVQAGYHTLFEKLDWFVSVTQEFGTYPSPFVAIELVRENQAHHHGSPDQRLKAGERLKGIFSPSSQSFTELITRRGLIALLQSL